MSPTVSRLGLVRGVGSHNGGAELLLRSTTKVMGEWGDQAAVDVRQISSRLRGDWKLGRYWDIQRFKRLSATGLDFLPRQLARTIGMSSWRHVDYVLDASGFSFGDQWGTQNILQFAYAARRWRRLGVPVALLPQAFGPFERPDVRSATQSLFESVDLICARDGESEHYLRELLGDDHRIKRAPDITIGFEAPVGEIGEAPDHAVIIPNINLVTRSSRADAMNDYVEALVDVADNLRAAGLAPALMQHSKHGDPNVIEAVRAVAPSIPIVIPRNGYEAKLELGRAAVVISGRYHGLVSALSCGVPVVAHSWSHKYSELMNDFGQVGVMADPFDADAATSIALELLERRQSVRVELRAAGDELRAEVAEMWSQVHSVIAR